MINPSDVILVGLFNRKEVLLLETMETQFYRAWWDCLFCVRDLCTCLHNGFRSVMSSPVHFLLVKPNCVKCSLHNDDE